MAAFKRESFPTTGLSALESQILKEKAKGLSDLEVALRLFLYEREVRVIVQALKRRSADGKFADPSTFHTAQTHRRELGAYERRSWEKS
jgi:hypothetical protein